jgi:hypothetical protein
MVRQERLYEYIDYFLHLIIYDKLSKITNQGLGLFFKTSIGALIHPRNLLWAKKKLLQDAWLPFSRFALAKPRHICNYDVQVAGACQGFDRSGYVWPPDPEHAKRSTSVDR